MTRSVELGSVELGIVELGIVEPGSVGFVYFVPETSNFFTLKAFWPTSKLTSCTPEAEIGSALDPAL
jgi:hypothetical protein